ncbi:RdgB/HAM1 family non-canonical purine NTP pyrophosphatase [Ekhidna sp.]
MKICFASHNPNKVKEMAQIMSDHFSIVGLNELGISEDIEETGDTFEENSRIKARYVYEKHGIPTFADDSGLSVSSLDGEPGVYSARYAGKHKNDDDNIDLLLENLKDISDRSAKFQTVVTFIDDKGNEKQFSGEVKGKIIEARLGTNGFGYDPIFQPEEYEETFAQLSIEVKNRISHRAKAVQKLLEHLNQTYV